MSDIKKGLGVFIKKKADGAGSAPLGASNKPKDVKKRWLMVGGAVIAMVILSTTIFGDKPAPVSAGRKDKTGGMISVNPPNADKAAFESRYGKDLESVKSAIELLKQENDRKDAELKKLKEDKEREKRGGNSNNSGSNPNLPPNIVPPPVIGNNGGLGSLGGQTPPPPPPPVRPSSTGTSTTTGSPEAPALTLPPSIGTPSGGSDPLIFDAPSSKSSSTGTSSNLDPNNPPSALGGGVNSKVTYKKNANAGMMPAGAFAPVSLLNGVDAGTGSATQSNPMPILMNVTDQATLPGAAKYRIKNCFVLGTGYGDASAERVYVRFSKLSCVDKTDKLVLSQDVAGYVVDSDGKLGLRGMVSDKQGAKLSKALLAGFAQGLAGALGSSQSTVSSNTSTGTSTSLLSGGAALRASGLSGAQSAASQLADFYLKEAQTLFPTITVDAGRTATIVFSNSIALNWGAGEGAFTSQVTPSN